MNSSVTRQPTIGPALISTLFSRDAATSVKAWCDFLHQTVHHESTVSSGLAQNWGYPELAGAAVIWLANELNEPWLRIIDSPNSQQSTPFRNYGWLSLEISVANVDSLYETLKDSPFQIIGKPANLDVSDDIRAMQVIGLDGEVLYLTEVKAAVPPFEIPFARCEVDRLFIPVAIVPDRDAALAWYESFEHTKGMQFDTKITVINRALGHPIETRHPVSTVQLAGANMVELDQIDGLVQAQSGKHYPATGFGMVSFQVAEFPEELVPYVLTEQGYSNRRATITQGVGGELIELIGRAS